MDKISQYRSLLGLLRSERFVSGSVLAQQLGVSRTVVNRRLQELEGMGLRVHAVTGRGYHLADPFTMLDDPPRGFPAALAWHHHLITTSTNEDALALVRLHEAPVLVATEYQTQGRGRRGRAWSSAFGQDLAFSLGFPLSSPEALRPFSLAAGVILAEAVAEFCGLSVSVKWPNDLQVDGAKLAGILTEIHTLERQTVVLLGIGMNVNRSDMSTIGQSAVSLAGLTGAPVDRSALLSALAGGLAAALADDFRFDWHRRWPHLDALAGKPLRVQQGESWQEGVGAGVAEDGSLRLQTRDGLQMISGGQVSVRPL
ncbi:biotin--[acetyl-CoA-carboxylase] ligase [Natronospirillum operosum]|uniref:Biotin--[acetyl-CoA-carboxylase] ligase n=1 Tax=Natronospirillum operosum TaxID=2759953 RepID=A0A4Z0W1P5_9GAMM|nr:biotin--[acetyl-CoA-carboxylase] ligase [Natronospirillum operosum]TGG90151.1 biotin--[acetyl-CoA-carboxylase] ligase [Natronospirillum operosum]